MNGVQKKKSFLFIGLLIFCANIFSISSVFSYDYSEFPEGVYEGDIKLYGNGPYCDTKLSKLIVTDSSIIIYGLNEAGGIPIKATFKIKDNAEIKLLLSPESMKFKLTFLRDKIFIENTDANQKCKGKGVFSYKHINKEVDLINLADGKYFASLVDVNNLRWTLIINKTDKKIEVEKLLTKGGVARIEGMNININRNYDIADKIKPFELDEDGKYDVWFNWLMGNKSKFVIKNNKIIFSYYVNPQAPSAVIDFRILSYDSYYDAFTEALKTNKKLNTKNLLTDYQQEALNKKKIPLKKLKVEAEQEEEEKEFKKQESITKEKTEKLEVVSSPYESIPNGTYRGNLVQSSYGTTNCMPANVNSIRVTDEYIIFSMIDNMTTPVRYKVDKKGPQGQKFSWLRGSIFTVNLKFTSRDAIIMTLGGQCPSEPAIFTNVQFLEDNEKNTRSAEKKAKEVERERKKQERLAEEKAEEEKLLVEKAEKERKKQERIAKEKVEEEQEKAERERKKQERLAEEKAEEEKLLVEKAERERKKQERIAKEKVQEEQEKAERERKKQERIAKEKVQEEQEKAERERKKQERIAKEKAEDEREKAERERKKQEKIAKRKAKDEKKKAEKERKKQEKIAKQKAEEEKLLAEKAEKERKKQERLAKQKADKEERARKIAAEERLIEIEIAKLQAAKKLREAEREAERKIIERERLKEIQLEKERLEEERKIQEAKEEKIERERLKEIQLEKERLEEERKIQEAKEEKIRKKEEEDRILAELAAKEKLRLQKEKLSEIAIQKEVLNDFKKVLLEIKNQVLLKKSKIEELKLEIYEMDQKALLEIEEERLQKELQEKEKADMEKLKKQEEAAIKREKQLKAEAEIERQKEIEREKKLKAEAERMRQEKILKENLEKKRLQQEVIITEIRDNIVWTDLNVKYLLADIKTFIDSHKSEIDILLFIELFKPVNSNKNKLIANEIDINNIEALEKLLLDNDSYKKIRFKSLLDRRAKELYQLDLSVKELKDLLQLAYEVIIYDPLDDKIFDLTVLYEEHIIEREYNSIIEVNEIIEKFKAELERIGKKY